MKKRVNLVSVILSILLSFMALTEMAVAEGKHFTDDSVDGILKQMTIEEKVGQIMVGFFEGAQLSPELLSRITNNHLGGVILYSSAGNIENVDQVAKLVTSIQKTAFDSHTIPLFIAIDQEGGRVVRLTDGVTLFPGNMALGAAAQPELAEKTAAITARELRALGINLNFAPSVDVNSNPYNPIIGVRSFGSNPEAVARLGAAMINAYRDEGVVSTAKHFPGHGDTNIDSHHGLPVVFRDRNQLDKVEFFPFEAMAKAGVPAIMTAHVVLPAIDDSGLPATMSPQVLNILRRDMNFNGVIFTDSMTMGAIVDRYGLEEASIQAFLAGADVLLFGADKGYKSQEQDEVYRSLIKAVETGRIPVTKLDQSVRRILTVKKTHNILDNPLPNNSYPAILAAPENLAVAYEVAAASITLVKNNNLLKVNTNQAIPIIWPKEFEANIVPLLKECKFLQPYFISMEAGNNDLTFLQNSINQSPVVIVGSYDLNLNSNWVKVIRRLNADKTVVMAMRSPYDLMLVPEVGAYVACYSDKPVTMKALGEFLKGELEPSGHLPVDLPGLYPQGWGLTKTFSR